MQFFYAQDILLLNYDVNYIHAYVSIISTQYILSLDALMLIDNKDNELQSLVD